MTLHSSWNLSKCLSWTASHVRSPHSSWNLSKHLSQTASHAWKLQEYYFLQKICMTHTSDACKLCGGHPSITQQLKDTWVRTMHLMQWTGCVGCVRLPPGEGHRLDLIAQFPYWQGCVVTQAPIAVARAIGTKCPLSRSGGNCYTYLDLKHGCKYLATCQWKHSQEGYLNCQRMTTKTNSHDAVMNQCDWQ